MEIRVVQLLEGARAARGTAVVIDVFRAFSVVCYLLEAGAREILPVADRDEALALKAAHPGSVLVGERGGVKLPEADFGNSPTEIRAAGPGRIAGRTVIHTTSAGTQGLAAARNADVVLTGALVNAPAVAAWLLSARPSLVSLVCMGENADTPNEEDIACAEVIRDLLMGRSPDVAAIRERLRRAPSTRKFFDPAAHWAPEDDFAYCLDVGRFPFVLRAERREDRLRLRRLDTTSVDPPRFGGGA